MKNNYRMASWWFTWEDLLFPEPGVERKMEARAAKFADAGIDTVVVFGFHFRWDYIYNWDRLHYLMSFLVDVCHRNGIKVFDHHSANLTHRVRSLEEYRNINEKNRHHVPFFPSREFADSITFNGARLNDFRMVSVRDGVPCYLPTYNAETFCMNNPDFLAAYKAYLAKLLPTGVDGLMCDDIIYYPSWDACGCEHCREKFKELYGRDLPPADDEDFWGNYDSTEFKEWMTMRYNDPFEFLDAVRETLPAGFPLLSCCSTSTSKHLDGSGMNITVMANAMNHVMLEICGEIVDNNSDLANRIPDFMLHKGVAERRDSPNIGLGYAHNPDSAFVIWGLNKLFASDAWISTLTGRFGISEELRKTIPDEADIIREAFSFERDNESLFRGESAAKTALLFSLDSLKFNGPSLSDYSKPWTDAAAELFRRNIQFDVVDSVPMPDEYPLLVLPNLKCVSVETRRKLLGYAGKGGVMIATGPLGRCDENGVPAEKSLLDEIGVSVVWDADDAGRKVSSSVLFAGGASATPETSETARTRDGSNMPPGSWTAFGTLHWTPNATPAEIAEKAIGLSMEPECDITLPKGWRYRVLKDEGRLLVHILAVEIEAIPYETFKNTLTNQPVVEKLHFNAESGEISISSSKLTAELHSPDLSETITQSSPDGRFVFKSESLKRYAVIELR